MNRRTALFVLISLVSIVLSVEAFVQMGIHWRGGGGWGMGAPYGRMYDPKTVETVSGEVERVDMITPMKGMSGGVHLVVKTDQGPVSVHLGPA